MGKHLREVKLDELAHLKVFKVQLWESLQQQSKHFLEHLLLRKEPLCLGWAVKTWRNRTHLLPPLPKSIHCRWNSFPNNTKHLVNKRPLLAILAPVKVDLLWYALVRTSLFDSSQQWSRFWYARSRVRWFAGGFHGIRFVIGCRIRWALLSFKLFREVRCGDAKA